MVFGLKKFLFKGGAGSPANLPEDVRLALEAWCASKAPGFDEPHFHTRYVVIDIATSGSNPAEDELLGIAAVGLRKGAIQPADAFALDLGAEESEKIDAAAVDRHLMAFLTYAAKAPLVTYHGPFVSGFLQRAFKERLGVDFQPQWIDLAWLLPSLFTEKSQVTVPLDDWLEMLGIAGTERRDTMANTLMLARLFQMLLVRATGREITTAGKLVEESQAATFLRRNH